MLRLAELALNTRVEPVHDHSWPHGEATVLEVRDPDGRAWIVKRVAQRNAYDREVHALTRWAPRLGEGRAPGLRAALPDHSLLVMDRLPGRAGTATTPGEFRQAGELIRLLHDAEPARPDPDHPARAAHNVDGWLHKVPGIVDPADVDFVRAQIALMESMPAPLAGPIHNDNQPRNWLSDVDGTVRLIDFGKAKRDLRLRDFERMRQAEWRADPSLGDAFLDGYGRPLTDDEERMLVCIGAVAALTTILWARAHGDPGFENVGRETLHRLRTT